jgi:hypothetical protein
LIEAVRDLTQSFARASAELPIGIADGQVAGRGGSRFGLRWAWESMPVNYRDQPKNEIVLKLLSPDAEKVG